jgi:hypothetical protein
MGTYAGPASIGATAAGTGVQAYGNAEGLKAMRRVWGSQDEAQRGYDAQLAAKTAELIAGLNPTNAGAAEGQARTAKLDAGSKNVVAAVQAQGGKKKGGARGGTEARALATQQQGATLANALQGNRLAGIIAGLQQGGTQMDLLGRRYGQDAQNIRGDARRWASLAPLQEQAAGMNGQAARQIGSLFNTLGQAGMNYAMVQPRTAGQEMQGQLDNGWQATPLTWDK